MTDSHDDTRLWPASPYDLADAHRCPACFTLVSQPVCTGCGLALTDARASRVLELGRRILSTEQERQSVIAAIRAAQVDSVPVAHLGPPPEGILTPVADDVSVSPPLAAAMSASVSESAPASETVATPAGAIPAPTPPFPAPLPPAYATPAVEPTAAPAPPDKPRRRLTVPVLLLIVGVSLVGVAAVFFVTLAWFVTGIAVRAVIVGAITVATIVVASILRRRALPATAEGIAALGVVLLGLDAWAVRANDLFGAGDTRPAVWAGAATLVVAVLLRLWSRLSALRVPDLAASLALPAGLGLLIGGLLDLPPAEAIAAGLLGASAGGLLHALPAPWSAARPPRDAVAERLILAVAGVCALVGGALVGVFATTGIGALVWVNVAVVALGGAHALVLTPRDGGLPGGGILRGAASTVAALSVATVGWQLAWRDDAPVLSALVAPVAAVGVAAILDRLRVRTRWLTPATIAAGGVAAVTIVGVALLWIAEGALRIADTWALWRTDAATAPFDLFPPVMSVVATLLVAAFLFVAPTPARPVLRDVRAVACAVLLLAAVSRTAVPLAIVGVGGLIAVGSAVMLVRAKARTGWVVVGVLGAVGAYLAGLAVPWLWLIAVAIAAALPIAQRVAARPAGARAVASVVAPVVVLSVSAFIAPSAIGAVSGLPSDPSAAFVLLGWVALVAVAGAVLIRIDVPSRSALVYAGAILAAVAAAAVAIAPGRSSAFSTANLLEPWLAIPRGAALVILFALVALRRTALGAAPAAVSAFLLAPLGVVTADAVVRSTLVGPLESSGRVLPGWAPLVYTAVAAAFVWAAAAASGARSKTVSPRTRVAIDLGALVAALVVVWPIDDDLRGALLAIVGVGIAGASVSRGWAAPAGATSDGFPTTRAEGAPVEQALRRLLAWPAFGVLTIALWVWLDGAWPEAGLEAYVIAPAIGLLAFGALLLWLRRRVEAAVAVGLGLALGLVAPAVVSWTGPEIRGIVVAAVASAACLALTLTPARRVSAIAVMGASVSLAAVVIAALGRAWLDEPVHALWLALALAVALASAAGLAHGATSSAATVYATVAPSLVLLPTGAAAVLVATETPSVVVASVVLALTLALHIACAASHRLPFASVLRATSLAAAALAGGAFVVSGVLGEVEFASVPVGIAILAGALVSARRPGHSAPLERGAWIAGLVAATAPSLLAQPDALRVWLVIGLSLAAALGLVFSPIVDVARLKAPSAIVLTGAAVAMALRALAGPSDAQPELAAIVTGVGAVAVAAGLVRVGDRLRAGAVPTIVAAVGALLVIWTVALRLDGTLPTTAAVAIVAGALGVGGALLLGSARWFGFASVVALGGAVTSSIAIGVRISILSATTLEPDVWALIGLAIVAAVVVAALRTCRDRRVGLVAGGILSLALALFATAEISLLQAPGAEWRALLAVTVVSVGGVAGYILRARVGLVLLIAAGVVAVAVAVAAVIAGIRPIEVVTVPPALAGVVVGAWRMRTNAGVRSWPALGIWLGLLTVPSLLHDFFGGTDLWRVVALGIVAIALVLVGAIRRLQAPLVLGSAVLLVHAVAQLWPWIAAGAYVDIWWLWLGLGGALLIFVAATYEKRMRQLKTAYLAVTSLR
ncbi:MAG: hypothetical protein ABW024_01290 [Microbacterium sp.]